MSEVNKGGRPTKYKPEYNEQAYKLSLLGATDVEIADFFEVNQDTIYEWKNVYPKFSEAIRDGKTKADYCVAHKLYDKALGAEWTEDYAAKCKTTIYDDKGKKVSEVEEIKVVPVRKAAPPDTQAISLWLRNRKSDKWKDRDLSQPLTNQTVNLIVVANPEPDGHTITITPEAINSLPQQSN